MEKLRMPFQRAWQGHGRHTAASTNLNNSCCFSFYRMAFYVWHWPLSCSPLRALIQSRPQVSSVSVMSANESRLWCKIPAGTVSEVQWRKLEMSLTQRFVQVTFHFFFHPIWLWLSGSDYYLKLFYIGGLLKGENFLDVKTAHISYVPAQSDTKKVGLNQIYLQMQCNRIFFYSIHHYMYQQY